MKRRLVAFFIVFTILLGITPLTSAKNFTYEKDVRSFLVGNVDTGEIFYKKNENDVFPVASVSKLMTYLVVKDEIAKGKIKLTDIVLIDNEAAKLNIPGYSRMDLSVGDKISIKTLLEGLILVSANDGANALAMYVGGSLDNFVKMMNEKALEIGLKNSKFINASGLTEEDSTGKSKYNQMSAMDMFILSKHIVQNYPEIEEYSKIKIWKFDEKPNYEREPFFSNHDMPSMLGLKSGFTEEAGYCYAGYFDFSKEDKSLNDLKVVTVVMGAKNYDQRVSTTLELAKYIRDDFVEKKVLQKDLPFIDKYDKNTEQKYIPLYPEKDYTKILDKNSNVKIEYKVYDEKKAPYSDGEELGEIIIKFEDKTENVKLINKGFVPKQGFFNRIINSLEEIFENILMLF